MGTADDTLVKKRRNRSNLIIVSVMHDEEP